MPDPTPIEQSVGASGDNGRRTTLVSIAAVGGVLAASSCCLPVLPLVVAAGFAGGSTFLSAARPYLLGVSILLIAYGFYQAGRAKKCKLRPSRRFGPVVGLRGVRVHLDFLSPGDGERSGGSAGAVNL